MTREIMHPNANDEDDEHNQRQLLDENNLERNTNPSPSTRECHALLKRQQLIFAQLLRKEHTKRHSSFLSGYKLFRLEQNRGKQEWNALPLATRAQYHELAAEKIRLYKERLHR